MAWGGSRRNGIVRTLEESAHGHPRESILPHVVVLEAERGEVPGADGIFEITFIKNGFKVEVKRIVWNTVPMRQCEGFRVKVSCFSVNVPIFHHYINQT